MDKLKEAIKRLAGNIEYLERNESPTEEDSFMLIDLRMIHGLLVEEENLRNMQIQNAAGVLYKHINDKPFTEKYCKQLTRLMLC